MEIIAATNSAPASHLRLRAKNSSTKSVTITRHTISAAAVQKLIAQLARRNRRARCALSVCTAARAVWSSSAHCCSKLRARSITRASRFAMTPSNPAMPVSRNTGAIASWIAWAMMPVSVGI